MAKVTLTFDNGPEPAVTHHVLDTLAQYEINSSFFIIGRKMENAEGRAAVARAKAEGHWIGNHSYSHSVSTAIDHLAESKRIEHTFSSSDQNFPFVGEQAPIGGRKESTAHQSLNV